MDSDFVRLPFTWKQLQTRSHKEDNRRLKSVRVISFHPATHSWIYVWIGELKKYDDFLHFYSQTNRVFLPEPSVREVFDDVVNDGWLGGLSQTATSAKYRKKLNENWLDTIAPLSDGEFWGLLERQRGDFSPRLEALDSLGRFAEGYLFYDYGLNVELLVKFEHAYCRLCYEYYT